MNTPILWGLIMIPPHMSIILCRLLNILLMAPHIDKLETIQLLSRIDCLARQFSQATFLPDRMLADLHLQMLADTIVFVEFLITDTRVFMLIVKLASILELSRMERQVCLLPQLITLALRRCYVCNIIAIDIELVIVCAVFFFDRGV